MACLVTGTIRLPSGELFDGTITILPDPATAKVDDGYMVTAAVQEVDVAGGELSVSLEAGRYQVRFPGTRRFWIGVPTSAACDIADIVLTGATSWSPDGLRGSCFISDERPTDDPGLVDGSSTFHLVRSAGNIMELWAWSGTQWEQLI